MSEAQALRVVIVEDDAMMRAFVAKYLGADYELIQFSDGGEVLAWLESGQQAHLLILDLSMPETSGMEVLQWVRERHELDPTAIMILSGEDSSDVRVGCLEAGADDYLVKPFNPRELMARVRNLLRRTR
jgi:DNA-binding response OmpR family regulator